MRSVSLSPRISRTRLPSHMALALAEGGGPCERSGYVGERDPRSRGSAPRRGPGRARLPHLYGACVAVAAGERRPAHPGARDALHALTSRGAARDDKGQEQSARARRCEGRAGEAGLAARGCPGDERIHARGKRRGSSGGRRPGERSGHKSECSEPSGSHVPATSVFGPSCVSARGDGPVSHCAPAAARRTPRRPARKRSHRAGRRSSRSSAPLGGRRRHSCARRPTPVEPATSPS